ncbi:MAG: hypothetical protein HFH35_09715 [Eubacterium sp.]|nr:hypothetical protein [Eubacterium sp.]
MLGVFRQYNGDSLYLAAFAASMGLLYYREKTKGRQHHSQTGQKAVTALALALLFVFNGLAYRILGKFNDASTYYRFFWMLPVLFGIAYPLTQAFAAGEKKKMAAAFVILAVCLAFGKNFFFANKDYWHLPQNQYGLDANTIMISDAIMDDWEQAGQPSAQSPVAAFDMFLEYQVRTYEPRIQWGISRKAYLYQAQHGYDYKKYARQQSVIAAVNEGRKEDRKVLRHCLDKIGINYLAIRTEFDMDGYLAEISVLPIAHSVSYTLYKVK